MTNPEEITFFARTNFRSKEVPFGIKTDDQREYLGDVLTSSRHLLQLINDILDLAKVEAGKLRLDISRLELDPLLSQAAAMLRTQTEKRGVRVHIEASPELAAVDGDAGRLKQVPWPAVGARPLLSTYQRMPCGRPIRRPCGRQTATPCGAPNMTALPAASLSTNAAATQGDVKTFLTNLRDYLNGLLGSTGLPADARAALGVAAITLQNSRLLFN
jgi:hypothetical protein